MSSAQQTAHSAAPFTSGRANPVPVGSQVYNRITQRLYEEALQLDEMQFIAWSTFLAEDLVYTAPMRASRQLADQAASIVRTQKHFDEDYMSMRGRIGRLTQTTSAYAEDPPSRTRRFITNILVHETATAGEYAVTSYGLLSRNRFEEDTSQMISYMRDDILRDVDGELKLAKREIILDMVVLGTQNLAIFL
jgi:3-phenylpropionate/cinnamic acid dioxygenase small subunit